MNAKELKQFQKRESKNFIIEYLDYNRLGKENSQFPLVISLLEYLLNFGFQNKNGIL